MCLWGHCIIIVSISFSICSLYHRIYMLSVSSYLYAHMFPRNSICSLLSASLDLYMFSLSLCISICFLSPWISICSLLSYRCISICSLYHCFFMFYLTLYPHMFSASLYLYVLIVYSYIISVSLYLYVDITPHLYMFSVSLYLHF